MSEGQQIEPSRRRRDSGKVRKSENIKFWHRLAIALGMTLKEVQSRVDSAEFSRWQAYYKVEPFGEERADMRSAVIASTLANIHRGKGKAYTLNDFMIDFSGKEKKSAKEMSDIFSLFAGVHNKKVTNGI
jgi:hypothetical protein